MTCERCTRGDVGHIEFSSMGTGMSFHYCRHCENRWWTNGSNEVALDAVLRQASECAKAS